MGKREFLERFIQKANALEIDYGLGTKPMPLISQLPSDPIGVYTTNTRLLHIPLIGDLDNEGEKFSYPGITTPAPIQNLEWRLVPRRYQASCYDRIRNSRMGQWGDKYDPRIVALLKVNNTTITVDSTAYTADQEKETI